MLFSTTPIYALGVAAIWLILWLRVTLYRASTRQSIGDGGDQRLLLRIRQHGNCADWVTLVLILMILAEGMGGAALYLHISGVLLLVGRLAHPFGLKIDHAAHALRIVGNSTNILAALTAMICIGANILGL